MLKVQKCCNQVISQLANGCLLSGKPDIFSAPGHVLDVLEMGTFGGEGARNPPDTAFIEYLFSATL